MTDLSLTPRLRRRMAALAAAGLIALPFSCASPGTSRARGSAAFDYSHYDTVLAAHVSGRGGLVDYAGLRDDPTSQEHWQAHLEAMAEADPAAMAAEDRKAFWLNAYNTYCIEGILRHPGGGGPNDIEGYFDQRTHRVAGQDLTVNQMQYEILMPEFKDARLHFALVCADFGCTPLEDEAFEGHDLEERLVDLSYRFARDSGRFRIDPEDGVVHASMLFDESWYAKDFTEDAERPSATPVQYMAPWVTPEERRFLLEGEYEVRIIPWDWRLNEWRPEAAIGR